MDLWEACPNFKSIRPLGSTSKIPIHRPLGSTSKIQILGPLGSTSKIQFQWTSRKHVQIQIYRTSGKHVQNSISIDLWKARPNFKSIGSLGSTSKLNHRTFGKHVQIQIHRNSGKYVQTLNHQTSGKHQGQSLLLKSLMGIIASSFLKCFA